MSANEQIGRLQLLLERVQGRAAGPRGNGSGAAHAVHAAPVAAVAVAAAPAPAPAFVEEEAPISASPETPAQAHASVNPAAYPSDVPPAAEVAEAYDEYGEVEVSSEVVEVDIDVEEGEPMESGAQPVAAQATMPPEELEEVEEQQPLTTQQPHASMSEPEEVTQTAPANEIEEPTPSSSRRPIAGEEPVVAYEEESAPRHTPPPESGKQVAAAPSNRPPSGRPSVPPPSLEGHTLIGGWREPGLGGPQIGVPGATGVRVPPPPRANEPAPVVQAQASGTRLSPDVTQPQLAASANVASFQGAPPVARPTTLGELLDLTLSL